MFINICVHIIHIYIHIRARNQYKYRMLFDTYKRAIPFDISVCVEKCTEIKYIFAR